MKGGGGQKAQKGVLGLEFFLSKSAENSRKYGPRAPLKGGDGQKAQKSVLGPEKKSFKSAENSRK